MKKKVVIKGEDWISSIYSTKEWHNSVEVIRYEHDYEKKLEQLTKTLVEKLLQLKNDKLNNVNVNFEEQQKKFNSLLTNFLISIVCDIKHCQ